MKWCASAEAHLEVIELLAGHRAALAGHLLKTSDLVGCPIVALRDLLHDFEVVRSAGLLGSASASSQGGSEFFSLCDDRVSSIGRAGQEGSGEGVERGHAAGKLVQQTASSTVRAGFVVDILDESVLCARRLVVLGRRSVRREELQEICMSMQT